MSWPNWPLFLKLNTEHQVVLSTGGITSSVSENGAEAQIFASASPEDVMTLVDAVIVSLRPLLLAEPSRSTMGLRQCSRSV